MKHGVKVCRGASRRVGRRLFCPHPVKILYTVHALGAGLEGGRDFAPPQLVPVDATEEGMLHDIHAAIRATAQPLVHIPCEKPLQKVLCISAQKRCSTNRQLLYWSV